MKNETNYPIIIKHGANGRKAVTMTITRSSTYCPGCNNPCRLETSTHTVSYCRPRPIHLGHRVGRHSGVRRRTTHRRHIHDMTDNLHPSCPYNSLHSFYQYCYNILKWNTTGKHKYQCLSFHKYAAAYFSTQKKTVLKKLSLCLKLCLNLHCSHHVPY
jgi:hypothetical protein